MSTARSISAFAKAARSTCLPPPLGRACGFMDGDEGWRGERVWGSGQLPVGRWKSVLHHLPCQSAGRAQMFHVEHALKYGARRSAPPPMVVSTFQLSRPPPPPSPMPQTLLAPARQVTIPPPLLTIRTMP